jgi:hypothetical protein
MAGVCLIRLERVRPAQLSAVSAPGLASDNVAYRIAVEWDDPENGGRRQGVYVPRRDTSSSLQRALGGRFFPGEYHHSRFEVTDRDGSVHVRVKSDDGGGDVEFEGAETDALPVTSVFGSIEAASTFFEEGSVGYSATSRDDRLDGLLLLTESWAVRPMAAFRAKASFFDRIEDVSPGAVEYDNTLIMRDVPHEWRALAALDSRGDPTSAMRPR